MTSRHLAMVELGTTLTGPPAYLCRIGLIMGKPSCSREPRRPATVDGNDDA
jgi:hypothetical protein